MRQVKTHYHHGELRDALLAAALDSLDVAGSLPSWRALARACAVSQTAPYRHFESFEALRVAVATECFARLTQAVRTATVGRADPFAALAAGLHAYVDFAREHPRWYALMFAEVPTGDAGLRAAGAKAYATLVDGIAACGVREPADAAYTLWCAIHGIADLSASGLKPPISGARARGPRDGVIAMCLAHVRSLAAGPAVAREGLAGAGRGPGSS